MIRYYLAQSRLLVFFLVLASFCGAPRSARANEWYVTWGYSRDVWLPSDIHVYQPALGNDFTIHNVKAADYPQWDDGLFGHDITVPQFNLRIGRFLDEAEDFAVELSIDHSKYTTKNDQTARITGVMNGATVDTQTPLTPSFFSYRLHNGANHIMLSLVKRSMLWRESSQDFNLSLFLKGGAGILMPHAESTVMGNNSDVGPKSSKNLLGTDSGWWRLSGWTVGGEAALRFMLIRPVFLELFDKVAYASLSNVPIYEGRIDHALWMNEIGMSIGIAFGASAKGP